MSDCAFIIDNVFGLKVSSPWCIYCPKLKQNINFLTSSAYVPLLWEFRPCTITMCILAGCCISISHAYAMAHL